MSLQLLELQAEATLRIPPVPAEELERLFTLKHRRPHSILGMHAEPGGTVIRAWRPDARSMAVLSDSGERTRMERLRPEGLFEAVFPADRTPARYEFILEGARGLPIVYRDPYSFPPLLGEEDLRRFADGKEDRAYRILGAHRLVVDGARGVRFAVWAPNAEGISVVGEWNGWDGRIHPMRDIGFAGVWELFIPGVEPDALYKYEVHGGDGRLFLKTDPYAFSMEKPPASASRVHVSRHVFQDEEWMERRAGESPWSKPLSIYEVHLGSWCRVPDEGGRSMSYREIAPFLAGYAADMGFTHVELLPMMEHPYGPSWGYQVGGYFSPTARYGTPDDFRYLIDYLHRQNIGVILDWVPAHFPKDAFTLGRFDGTALYEHWDRRLGEHPDWNTFIFNYGRNEVRSFLLSNALYWLTEFHVDGLRLDAVASMLYRDYSRPPGDWIPNCFGGRENFEAVDFLRELNEVAHRRHPHVLMIAEESTAWPSVSRPTSVGGLGFGFKWNMGWMHDTLSYFSKEPVHRRYHHSMLTFGLLYAWNENFILPLSHDEVVHGKRSLLNRMPGSRDQKFAQLRALYGYMWAHPGKKLLFMGGEFGQWSEWRHDDSLDWHLLQEPDHQGLQSLVRDLNLAYGLRPPLWEADFESAGFEWLDAWNADENVLAFLRRSPSTGRTVICVSHFSPVPRTEYRLGLPDSGFFREVLNTDGACYGGTNRGNGGGVWAEPIPWHGRPWSARLTLPPFSTLWLEGPGC